VAIHRDQGTETYAAVVYNPIKVELTRLRAGVSAAAAVAGWGETLWFSTSTTDAGQQATRRALRQGVSVVIAAGGDGTVRAVAEALRGSTVPLAIVPSGTGNLLARNLNLLRTSVEESAAIAFSGTERAIDVGVASATRVDGGTHDHVFLVMAGVGLDARMIAATRATLKRQVGWLAYVDAGVRLIPSSQPFRIRYSVRGRPERHTRASSVLVANCGLLPGNMQFLPDAELDDGVLDIAVLQPKGMLGWLGIWRRVTWDNGVLRRTAVGRRIILLAEPGNERTMMTLRAGDIRISLEDPQEFELDGDGLGSVTSLFLRAEPRSLLVRVPAALPRAPRKSQVR
jgi:diacylglycerol kinase (ATP)